MNGALLPLASLRAGFHRSFPYNAKNNHLDALLSLPASFLERFPFGLISIEPARPSGSSLDRIAIHSTMQNIRTWRKFLCGSRDEVAQPAPAYRGGGADAPYSRQTASMTRVGSRRPNYAARAVSRLIEITPHPDHLLRQKLTNLRRGSLALALTITQTLSHAHARVGQDHAPRQFQGVDHCCKGFVLELRKSDEVSDRLLAARLFGPSTAGAIQSSDARQGSR